MSEENAFEIHGEWRDPAEYRGALVILTDPEGRAALQFRDRGAPVHPGRWGLFGGGVEEGETLVEAAKRELEEETGLILPLEAFTPYLRLLADGSRGRLYIFQAQADITPLDVRLAEGGGFGLFEPQDWRQLAMVPFTREILERSLEAPTG